jgi:hypothetical protein
LALAAPPMIEFRSWLIASQAAVPVAGPVVACGDPAALAAALPAVLGVLAALVCEPPLLLHPATATAATAIAPMASLFLIAWFPPQGRRVSSGVDHSRFSTMRDHPLAFCIQTRRLGTPA